MKRTPFIACINRNRKSEKCTFEIDLTNSQFLNKLNSSKGYLWFLFFLIYEIAKVLFERDTIILFGLLDLELLQQYDQEVNTKKRKSLEHNLEPKDQFKKMKMTSTKAEKKQKITLRKN